MLKKFFFKIYQDIRKVIIVHQKVANLKIEKIEEKKVNYQIT